MKLVSLKEYIIEENTDNLSVDAINEDVIDIIKTIINIRRIDNLGNKLKSLYIEKAKEKIISDNSNNPAEKDRSKKKVEAIDGKIDVISEKMNTFRDNSSFMKEFVKKKTAINKQNAKLAGLEILSNHYKTDDLNIQVKELRDRIRQSVEKAKLDKERMTTTEKEEVEKAKTHQQQPNNGAGTAAKPNNTPSPADTTKPDANDSGKGESEKDKPADTTEKDKKEQDDKAAAEKEKKDQEDVEKNNPNRKELDDLNKKIKDLSDKVNGNKGEDEETNLDFLNTQLKKAKLTKAPEKVINNLKDKIKHWEGKKWNKENAKKGGNTVDTKDKDDKGKESDDKGKEGRSKEDSIKSYENSISKRETDIKKVTDELVGATGQKDKDELTAKLKKLKMQHLEDLMDMADLKGQDKESRQYEIELDKLKGKGK